MGYNREDYKEFASLIYKILPQYKATQTKIIEYGILYDVKIILIGKNKRRLEVTTAWQIDKGAESPRLITITFPKKKKV